MNCRPFYGFTLIELMITLSIAALVMTLGVPSFHNTILENRMISDFNTLVAALNLTRSEAIARNLPVTLCKGNTDGTACDSGASWKSGWIIFTDWQPPLGSLSDNGNTTVCEAGEDCLLRTLEPLSGSYKIMFTNPDPYVSYDPMGSSQGSAGTFVFCDDRGVKFARGAVLSTNGRLRITKSIEQSRYSQCVQQ